jgi:hypothetical protein
MPPLNHVPNCGTVRILSEINQLERFAPGGCQTIEAGCMLVRVRDGVIKAILIKVLPDKIRRSLKHVSGAPAAWR